MSHYLRTLIVIITLAACNRPSPQASNNQHFNKKVAMNLNQRAESETYTRQEVIYGRTYGTALTMDVFQPKGHSNGRGIMLFISEGWYSEREKTEYNIPIYIERLIARGYTVFAVVHGSNPKFSLQENYDHAQRAVRFIRHFAKTFGIDGDKLGAIGDSAGGHLSLLLGSEGTGGAPDAEDSVSQESCRVQAVVAFFPPTDFFNWGEEGHRMFGQHPKVPLKGAFTFYEPDTTTNSLELVNNPQQIEAIVRRLSPIYQVNTHTCPTLIVYGDADSFIPVQQSKSLARRLETLGVVRRVVVEKGGEHDEHTIIHNLDAAIDWFNTYLK